MDNFNLLQQASQFAENGEFEKARQLIIKAIKNNRSDVEAWWAMAHVAQSDQERDRAVTEVLRLEPNHMHALHMRDQIQAGTIDSLSPQSKVGAYSSPATTEDFMPKVAVTLIAYFVIYFIGLILNIIFLYEANKFQKANGYKPQNAGCLWGLLSFFVVLPIGMICFLVFIFMMIPGA